MCYRLEKKGKNSGQDMTSTVVQQINLYQDEFRKKTDWLSARTLMQGIAVLAVAMGIHSALSFLSFSNVSRD